MPGGRLLLWPRPRSGSPPAAPPPRPFHVAKTTGPGPTSFQQLRRHLPTTHPTSGGPDRATWSPASRLSPASPQTPGGPHPHCP